MASRQALAGATKRAHISEVLLQGTELTALWASGVLGNPRLFFITQV